MLLTRVVTAVTTKCERRGLWLQGSTIITAALHSSDHHNLCLGPPGLQHTHATLLAHETLCGCGRLIEGVGGARYLRGGNL